MARKKAAKKAAKKIAKRGTQAPPRKGSVRLGSEAARSAAEDPGGGKYLKVQDGDNAYALVSDEVKVINEHYFPSPDGKKVTIECGVHVTGTDEEIMEAWNWGSPNHCDGCRRVKELFGEYRDLKDEDPVTSDFYKDIAGDCKSTPVYLVAVVPATEIDTRRNGNKKVLSPYFEDFSKVQILALTRKMFTMLEEKVEELHSRSPNASLVGQVIYMKRAKEDNRKYSQVTQMEWLKPVPPKDVKTFKKVPEGFGKMVQSNPYTEKAMETILEGFDAVLPELLAEKLGKGKGRKKAAKKTKKKATKKKAGRR